jgi:signal transduction histidine kinase
LAEIDHDFTVGNLVAKAVGHESDLLACFQHFLGHDLPNLFVSVQARARQILADLATETPDALRTALMQLTDLVSRTDDDVHHLVALGQLLRDAGKQIPIDLGDLCREAAAEAHWLCGDLKVDYQISKHLPVANVSALLVRAALVQVLRNAFVAGLPDRPVHVEVSGHTRGEEVVFEIVDNGRGLSPEQLHWLADLWDKGLTGTSWNGRGWFVVRHVLAASNGAVKVRSTLRQGTAVTLTFRS